jgi:small GTP-binding protein
MADTKKKICMLGAFAVGKSSLVRRFVHRMFSERYETTVGVRIDKKDVTVDGREVSLLIWDVHGEDEVQAVRESYLRGSSGYLLVLDGTRRATLDTAKRIHDRLSATLGDVPFVALVNKADLADEWELTQDVIGALRREGWPVTQTSAGTGAGVQEAFEALARKMVERGERQDAR